MTLFARLVLALVPVLAAGKMIAELDTPGKQCPEASCRPGHGSACSHYFCATVGCEHTYCLCELGWESAETDCTCKCKPCQMGTYGACAGVLVCRASFTALT